MISLLTLLKDILGGMCNFHVSGQIAFSPEFFFLTQVTLNFIIHMGTFDIYFKSTLLRISLIINVTTKPHSSRYSKILKYL